MTQWRDLAEGPDTDKLTIVDINCSGRLRTGADALRQAPASCCGPTMKIAAVAVVSRRDGLSKLVHGGSSGSAPEDGESYLRMI